MEFKELEAFVWIVKLGSFRKAAEHLFLTQPSISERIARLEEQLGDKVLRRDHRPVIPTLKGRELFRQAEHMLEQRQFALAHFRDSSDYEGVFRLGVVESIAHSWLPGLLANLSKTYPKMTIELEVEGTPALTHKLLNHELDLAFLMGPVNSEFIVNRPLCAYPLAFVGHPDMLETYDGAPVDYLRQAVLMTFSRDSVPYRDLVTLMQTLKIKQPRIHCSSSISTIARLAAEKTGLGVIPPIIVRRQISAGELMPIPLPYTLPPLLFTASWPASYDADLAENIAQLAMELSKSEPWGREQVDLPSQ
jgi:DNA-binding transcriptional LysR family regulator